MDGATPLLVAAQEGRQLLGVGVIGFIGWSIWFSEWLVVAGS